MAITINDKVFRNLQEQVGYLTDEYKALLKQLPYNGPYASTDDIPEDELVDRGVYLIGTDSYKIYKYDESTEDFTDLGYFGAKGDKGDTGATGATGAAGEKGDKGATGEAAGFGTPVINVTTVTPVEPATGTVTASGDDTEKVFTFDFEIPQGLQGDKGDKGDKGDTGAKGEKGDTGDPVTITLDGVVYESEDGNITLPDYPNTAIWGNVSGDIEDQSDLMAEFATKQDVISDLGTIRAGALDGSTALQSNDVATVALTGSYTDLIDLPNFKTVALTGSYTDLINVPDFKLVATTGNYNDLANKPTIGTATLTIQKNGTTIDTFNANAVVSKTIDIEVPTNNNQLTNGAGYITGITASDVTTALDYIPADVADLSTVATSGSYNDLSNKPHIPDTATSTSTSTVTKTFVTLNFTLADLTVNTVNVMTDARVATDTTTILS